MYTLYIFQGDSLMKAQANLLPLNAIPLHPPSPKTTYTRNFPITLSSFAMCATILWTFLRNFLYCQITLFGTSQEFKLRGTDILRVFFEKPSEEVTAILEYFSFDSTEFFSELPRNVKIYVILLVMALLLLALSAILMLFNGSSLFFYSQKMKKGALVFSFVTLAAYWILSLIFCDNIKTFIHEWSEGFLDVPVTTQTFLPVLLGGLILALVFFLESDFAKALKQQLTPTSNPSTSAAASEQDKITALSQYKKLMDDGIITEEEFQKKKEELLR